MPGWHGLHRHAQSLRRTGRVGQQQLGKDPFSGQLFAFRGKRGDLVKVLSWDGQGFCLYAKRLEKGRFIWPQAKDGGVSFTAAQLSMLLEGIDWRASVQDRPRQTRPQAAARDPATRDHRARRPLRLPAMRRRVRPLSEDVTDVLDYVPAAFRVIRHVRPKLTCRSCARIAQAPAPELPIRRGSPGRACWRM